MAKKLERFPVLRSTRKRTGKWKSEWEMCQSVWNTSCRLFTMVQGKDTTEARLTSDAVFKVCYLFSLQALGSFTRNSSSLRTEFHSPYPPCCSVGVITLLARLLEIDRSFHQHVMSRARLFACVANKHIHSFTRQGFCRRWRHFPSQTML